jgi:type II secretory pathway component PulL
MSAGRKPADNVIPLRPDPLAKLRQWTMTPKQLETVREMQRQNDEFWRKRAPQQQRARKPRNVDRNRRIHALAAEGKPANVIAKLVSGLKGKRLSASQVRKILAKPPVRVVSEK